MALWAEQCILLTDQMETPMISEQDRIDAERFREKAIALRKEAYATLDADHKDKLTKRAMQYEGLYFLMLDKNHLPQGAGTVLAISQAVATRDCFLI